MGKKNGRTRIKERDGWGWITVYTKPHPDLELWGLDKMTSPDYVILTVSLPDTPDYLDGVYQVRKADLIKALTR